MLAKPTSIFQFLLLAFLGSCSSHRPQPINHPQSIDPKALVTPDYIREVILAEIPQYRKCLADEYLKSGKKHTGAVRLKFTIQSNGTIKNSEAISESMPDTIKKCIADVSTKLKFAPVKDNQTIDVSQPLNFELK
jgi:hypothetical protein